MSGRARAAVLLLALASPGRASAACRGPVSARDVESALKAERLERGARDAAVDRLVDYRLCRALRGQGPDACAELRGVAAPVREPGFLEMRCRSDYRQDRVVLLANGPAERRPEARALCEDELAEMARHSPSFAQYPPGFCAELVEGFRAGYRPVCASLLRLPAAVDLHFECRTWLYPSGKRGCAELAEPVLRRRCERRAALIDAARRHDAARCGGDPICAALVGGEGASCEALLEGLEPDVCGGTPDGGRP